MDYEALVERLYRGVVRHGDRVVDIGAHSGRHTLPLADAVGPTGAVVAFEPLPRVSGYLRSAIADRGVGDRVTLHQVALSHTPGRASFFVATDRPEESGLAQRTVYNGPTGLEEIEVEVATLDGVLPPDFAPRFVKIDVEGAELDALRGAQRTIDAHRPMVEFEFGMNSAESFHVDPADMFDYWAGRGYGVMDILGVDLARDEFVASARVQHVWDYVATPSAADASLAAEVLAAGAPPGGAPTRDPDASGRPGGLRRVLARLTRGSSTHA